MANDLLTQEEFQEKFKAMKEGSQEARDELIERNMNLVYHVVDKKVTVYTYPKEDLVQIGLIGLIKAVDRFDTSLNVKFSTYAVPLIFGEILRHIRDDGYVRVSRPIKVIANKILRADLMDSTPEVIKKELNLEDSLAQITIALEYVNIGSPVSTSATVYKDPDGSEVKLEDTIPLSHDVNGSWFEKTAVKAAIKKLPEKYQKIIKMRYFEDKSQSEIGRVMGVTQVQISRTENKALRQLQILLTEDEAEYQELTSKGEKEPVKRDESAARKEKAIELLKTTVRTYQDIANEVGLSESMVSRLGKAHRPAHLRKRGARKPAQTDAVNKVRKGKVVKSDNIRFRKAEEKPKAKKQEAAVISVPSIMIEDEPEKGQATKTPQAGVVEFDFNLSLKGTSLSKGTAMEHLKGTMDLLNVLPTDQVTLNVKLEK
ncbi:RNA polymerase sigma factor [Bacillus phage 010DV004]|nr:RNA polymerase sigma factor [Bacillus phage 010DV004]QZA69326.1 RNA polymerase sigma factor [Bacillus phage 010DV005]